MIEKITVGASPWGENCAQIGSPNYFEQSSLECSVFKRQLLRTHPIPNGVPVSLVIDSSLHDFGAYREVAVRFDNKNLAATEYAYALEKSTPENWDALARYELLWYQTKNQHMRALRRGEIEECSVPSMYLQGHPPEHLNANATLSELLDSNPLI